MVTAFEGDPDGGTEILPEIVLDGLPTAIMDTVTDPLCVPATTAHASAANNTHEHQPLWPSMNLQPNALVILIYRYNQLQQ